MHVLISCVLIGIYGQGLALRGPVGSMAKAVDGMVIEQHNVIIVFCVAIFAFAFAAIGSHWIIMDTTGAAISTCVTVIGIFNWYNSGLRIYNRFTFESNDRDTFSFKSPYSNSPGTLDVRESCHADLTGCTGTTMVRHADYEHSGLDKESKSNTHEMQLEKERYDRMVELSSRCLRHEGYLLTNLTTPAVEAFYSNPFKVSMTGFIAYLLLSKYVNMTE
jgi:hypothetical protein